MMTLDNSYVLHHYLGVQDKSFVEGNENHIVGTVEGDKFSVKLTNSFGDPTEIMGKVHSLGPLWILKGTAYGYKHAPGGLSYTGFGLRCRKTRVYLALPTSISSWLEVRLDTQGER